MYNSGILSWKQSLKVSVWIGEQIWSTQQCPLDWKRWEFIPVPKKYQQPHICDWYHSNVRKWRGTAETHDESERGEWKPWLELSIQKTKIMASSPFTPWQIEGRRVEAVTDFMFLGSKIISDSDCSQEIKRCLLLRRKAMPNTDSVLKRRSIPLLTKVLIVKVMLFPVAMYRCERCP